MPRPPQASVDSCQIAQFNFAHPVAENSPSTGTPWKWFRQCSLSLLQFQRYFNLHTQTLSSSCFVHSRSSSDYPAWPIFTSNTYATGKGFHVMCQAGANPPLQGTPEKLRFSVPSGLRPPVAPELARYVSRRVTWKG